MSTATPTAPSPSFDYICKLVAQRAAIVLEPSKTYLVDARLTPVAAKHGLATIDDLVGSLKAKCYGPLHEEVVEALTTNETSFFRDLAPFEALRKSLLPEMVQKRSVEKSLSIWSAASSSGQELYSIALILKEHFPQLNSWQIRLLGTDLSAQMIERAQSGIYNQAEVNRGLPATHLVKYFTRQGLQWQVNDSIRAMATWRRLNLIETWTAIPQMDVIFLRNVLIYFSPETKRKVLTQIRKVLRPDGYLFLGGAETTLNLDDSFVRHPCDGAICYRLR